MSNPIPDALAIDVPSKWHSRDVFWFCMLTLVLGAGFGACGTMFAMMTAQPQRVQTADDTSRPVPPSSGANDASRH